MIGRLGDSDGACERMLDGHETPLYSTDWIDDTPRYCRIVAKRDNRTYAKTSQTPCELNCVCLSHESVLSVMHLPRVDLA
jgi:hypothetical protein